jgi:alkaline phosphatase
MSGIMVCDGHHRLAYVKDRTLQRMSDAPHMSTSRNRVTDTAAGAAFSSGNSSFGGRMPVNLLAEVAKIAPEAEIDA